MAFDPVFEGRSLPRDHAIRADAVVVGTGAGGAVCAAELAEAGLDVVMIEEGSHVRTREFDTDGPGAIWRFFRHAGTEVIVGRPPVLFAEGCCVGGSTVINGGICWRTPAPVLERWVRERGLRTLAPEAMEPIFARVERRLHVAPQDPGTVGGDSDILKLGADRLGWYAPPVRRNQLHCAGTGNCIFGCPTGAKQSTLLTYVPRALAAGARLYTECRAERVLSRRGRAFGVEVRPLDPETRRPRGRLVVHADAVILACGAIRTPALLLASGERSFPVGHNLKLHPNAKAIAIMDGDVLARGAIQGHQVHEFIDRGILMATTMLPPGMLALSFPYTGERSLDVMRAYLRMVVTGVLCEDEHSSGRVRLGPFGQILSTYTLHPIDARRLTWGVARLVELLFTAGARRVLLPYHGAPELTGKGDIPRLEATEVPAEDIELVTVHAMGTAAMGSDPRTSVVDEDGESHRARGLYVADASLFPGPVGVNPQVSIMALATKIAHGIALERGLTPSPLEHDLPASTERAAFLSA